MLAEVKAYLIMNYEVKQATFPFESLKVRDDGEFYFEDNYGMGAVHWSVISKPEEAFDRQLKDNVHWAKNRLNWAKQNSSPDEASKLEDIIKSNGYTRDPIQLAKFKLLKNDNQSAK